MADAAQKTSIKMDIPFSENISRLFIFRFLWVYILIFPMFPIVIWVGLVSFFHFWYMLFLGKRHKGMWDTTVRAFQWLTQWQSYLGGYTDMRPGFWF